MPARPEIPALLVLLALCQCGTGPAPQAAYPLQEGDRVEVVYQDGPAVLSLRSEALAEAGAPAPAGPAPKVASADSLRGLLGRWSELGFFEDAQDRAHGQAKASLALDLNGRRYVCSRLPLAMSSVEEVQQFHRYVTAFRTLYDLTRSYQSVQVDAGVFERENERLRQQAREAMARQGRK